MTSPRPSATSWISGSCRSTIPTTASRATSGGPVRPSSTPRSAQRFSPAFEQAIEGGLDHWRQSPDGALALILLCDQFPRNMHRRSAHAFAGDGKAMETARLALARFYPAAFDPTMRAFFYMPFQHSESLRIRRWAARCSLPSTTPR